MPRHSQGPYLTDAPNEFGFYEIRWTENGRSKRKSTGQTDYRAAQRSFAEFIIGLEEIARHGQGPNITTAQVIDAYVADKADVMSPESQRLIFGHLKAHFGDLLVTEVSEDDVRDYKAARSKGHISFIDAEGKLRGGVKAGLGTIRRELGMLSTAINYCIAKKKFKDPQGQSRLRPQDKPVIELPPAPPPRDRWLSRAEAAALLAACQPDPEARLTRVYRYVVVMLYTAARKETVYALPWERIHLDRGLINFAEPGRRVTKKRRGFVPIAEELQPILERAYKERTSEWFLDAPRPPFHALRAAAKRAGLFNKATGKFTVSPHVLRHTWATWAAQDGVSLFEIAGVLHDTVATVERRYAHHCPQHLRGAVNRPLLGLGA